VPDEIVKKPPSADLWKGQTDEGELGLTYQEADMILQKLVEENVPPAEAAKHFDPQLVADIVDRMEHTEFKRRMPRICEVRSLLESEETG
jgi:NAD+ synthase